jgi:uncharacterized membrane protein SpoIIM required for sporulation
MRRDAFIHRRERDWERLSLLLDRARSDLRDLTGSEILEMGSLYRDVAADLSLARREYPGDSVTEYLNALLARAHAVIYTDAPTTFSRIGRYVRYGFPAAYRTAARYTLTAFVISALAAIISYALVLLRPGNADVLIPGQAAWMRQVMRAHHLWMQSATSDHSVAANFIMLNNIQVAFLAFAGGIPVGLGTFLVMATNGINLGATAALVQHFGLSLELWSFVFPHGVIELSVIFMAGGAGLMIGDSLLRPGPLTRPDALARAARTALAVLGGCIPLLVIAGTIEGFFSASPAPPALKFAVGLVTGVALYGYLLLTPAAPSIAVDIEEQLAATAAATGGHPLSLQGSG